MDYTAWLRVLMLILKMPEKTLLLWDVGGVLLKLNYGDFYEEAAKLTGTTPEKFKQAYADSKLEFNTLRGLIPYDEQQKRIRQLLGAPQMSRDELEKIVTRVWGGELTEVVDIKERAYFKNNGQVLAQIFSNIDQFAWEYLSRVCPRMLQNFRADIPPICSYIVGDVKPSLAMYKAGQSSAEKLGCNRVILIEDKSAYLAPGIENFGWFGVHLTINIDPNEAIRQVKGHDDIAEESDKLFVANSVSELEQALRDFGVKV